MKYCIILASLLLFSVPPLHSFQYAAGLDHKTLYAVTTVNDSTAIAVGESGVTARTSDGGKHWIYIPCTQHQKNDLLALSFVNNLTGWAVGVHGTILQTINGGKSWI